MNALALLSQLKKKDIRLWLDRGRLRFDAPTGAMVPRLREQIIAQKDAIVALLQTQNGAREPERKEIATGERHEFPPLSFAQQTLWLFEQKEGPNPTYNLPMAFRFQGELSVSALEKSLHGVCSRHEILRTRFQLREDEAVQVISPHSKPVLSLIDLTGLTPAGSVALTPKLGRLDALRPFNLSQGPLLRVFLIRAGTDTTVLLTIHHIVFDDWSMAVLVRELMVFYRHHLTGVPLSLPPLPIQYADFAIWQRKRLQDGILDDQKTYWERQLKGLAPLLKLPTDHPRPTRLSYRGASIPFFLDASGLEPLTVFSRGQGATLFMTLLAAFDIVLSRYCGIEDIAVGSPIANRNRGELEPLIGFFVNSLVLRNRVVEHRSFPELLAEVRQTTLAAYAHQDLPHESLVQGLRPKRALNYAPLAQVRFILNNTPTVELRLPGLKVTPSFQHTEDAKFDLLVNLTVTPTGLAGWFQYSTDLFHRSTIARMAGHYLVLLTEIAGNPNRRIGDLSMMTGAQRQAMLWEWNTLLEANPPVRTFHDCLEAHVLRKPGHPAIVFEDRTLSIAELNAGANRIAHRLISWGLLPGEPVAVCLPRAPAMVMGLLGIAKAGGAFLPLDGSHPGPRLAGMIDDAAVRFALAGRKPGNLSSVRGIRILEMEEPEPSNRPEHNPSRTVDVHQALYIIYTSGSTGRPKGVMVTHASLYLYVKDVMARLRPGPDASFSFLASPTADLGHTSLLGSVVEGLTLRLFSESKSLDATGLAAELESRPVDFLKVVPTHLAGLMNADRPDRLLPRKCLILGGESPDPALIDRVRELRPELRIVNHYGPTETTVGILTHEIGRRLNRGSWGIPVGRPLDHGRALVLDGRLNPVPPGAVGHLLLGGFGLARTYLKRPREAAAVFLPDPFANLPGTRLYLTGDLARSLNDGRILFQGRKDHQLKIRGFRIEPGEVETALRGLPEVSEALVTVCGDPGVSGRLVAYITPAQGHASTNEILREKLGRLLPDHMVPDLVLALKEFPLLPSGKIDRKALPSPNPPQTSLPMPLAPNTPKEKDLLEIWRDVLGREDLGIRDNFFQSGGDSILSVLVVARANRKGLSVNPGMLFESPTVEALARAAGNRPAQLRQETSGSGLRPLPIQRWFFDMDLVQPNHWNQTLLLETGIGLDAGLAYRVLQVVFSYHEGLRLHFPTGAALLSGRFKEREAAIPFECHDLSEAPHRRQTTLVERLCAHCQTRLDIAAGPLFRAVWFYLGPSLPSRLLLVAHHLVMDGISWRILLADLQLVLRALGSGELPKLPAKTTSLQTWSEALFQSSNSGTIAEDLEYWRAIAAFPESVLPPDAAGQRPAPTDAELRVQLTEQETESLLRRAPQSYRTEINDLLLAALAMAYRQSTGQSNLTLTLEGHGRENIFPDLDLSRTLGWFTTLFPVSLEIIADTEPGRLIKAVKEQLRVIPHRGLGFGALRYFNDQGPASLGALPGGIRFNYLGQFDRVISSSSAFRVAAENPGPARDPRQASPFLIDINGAVAGGRLAATFSYSASHYREATVTRFANLFIQSLRRLIHHCLDPKNRGYTPSDFPDAGLDQPSLDRLTNCLNERGFREIEDAYPLSPLQRGMLYHSLTDPDSGVYVTQIAAELRGSVNVPAFREAWQRVTQRHAVFRTLFMDLETDRPLQLVLPRMELRWRVMDWRNLEPEICERGYRELVIGDRLRGFRFDREPSTRFVLVRFPGEIWRFLWSRHHALVDGWTTAIVLREVMGYYDWLTGGRYYNPPRPRAFRNYIRWLRSEDPARASDFWRDYLEGVEGPTPLPLDGLDSASNPDPPTIEGTVPEPLTHALQRLAAREQITLSVLTQGIWALLLARYCGEATVVFGTTVAGRDATLAGIAEMVGPFINTLPTRVDIPFGTKTLQLWRNLHKAQSQRDAFAYSSLVEIRAASPVPPDRPLFESLFVFENYPVDGALSNYEGGLRITAFEALSRTNFPLSLMVVPGKSLRIHLGYDGERYSERSARAVLERYLHLLEAAASNPEARAHSLRILTQAEIETVLGENAASPTPMTSPSLPERIEAAASRAPQSVALVFNRRYLTYRLLILQAASIARELRGLGIVPEKRVGIFLRRSPLAVAAMLAVQKSGGAFVYLDPDLATERMADQIEGSGLHLILTRKRLERRLPRMGLPHYTLDTARLRNPQARTFAATPPGPDHLAYLVFTSGSSGRPKPIAAVHRGVANYLAFLGSEYRLGERDVVLQIPGLGYDASIRDLFAPLCYRARVVLPIHREAADPGAVLTALLRHRITGILSIVPSLLRTLFETARFVPRHGNALRILLVSGETLLAADGRSMRRLFGPKTLLVNQYGPTETTMTAGFHRISERDLRGITLPVGNPIPNTHFLILDGLGFPLPPGATGLLFIAGAGLARGYEGQAGLTAASFLPHGFSNNPGNRIYRTGDLARRRLDRAGNPGPFELLGRADDQIKLLGHRIEPGEIEARLSEHQAVAHAAVVGNRKGGSHTTLTAFWVASGHGIPDDRELREFLLKRLHPAMVPAVFKRVDALPLTATGKLNRRALPRISSLNDHRFIAPQTPAQEILASMWADILQTESVGLKHNFFELGGHSLSAIRIRARVREIFNLDLPVRELFDHPVLEDFAARVEVLGKAGRARLPRLLPVDRTGPLPLSFAQVRIWFLARFDDGNALYNMPAAFRLAGLLDPQSLVRALGVLIQRHQVLRTAFHETDGSPFQIVAPNTEPRIAAVDLERLFPDGTLDHGARETVLALASREAGLAFDLGQGRLMRLTLLRIGPRIHVLLLNLHHIIADAWSLTLFAKELTVLYRASLQGGPDPLPPLPIQYADYAVRQREWLAGETIRSQIAFWKEALAGAPPLIDLPTDRPHSEAATFAGSTIPFSLPANSYDRLRALVRGSGSTPFMMLEAVFALLLCRYSGQADILVGTPVTNRNQRETQCLIGLFVNTLTLRNDLSGNPDFYGLMARVRRVALDAHANQDLPFEQVVERLNVDRHGMRHPIFQVMFVFQDEATQSLSMPGLELSALPIPVTTSKFELGLTMGIEDSAIHGQLEYSSELFEEATVRRMAQQFITLVEAAVCDPGRRIMQLPLLDRASRERILFTWNQTAAPVPEALTLPRLFEQQSLRTPDATALAFIGEDGTGTVLTYAHLDRRANGLARSLNERGVGPEIAVGVYIDRRPELALAILAIFKAGGVYVPLDPDYPEYRLKSILEDAAVPLVLTVTGTGSDLFSRQAECLALDALSPAAFSIEKWPDTELVSLNLAAIIFTSGSSGRPKGSLFVHGPLVSYVFAMRRELCLSGSDRVLQTAALGFDVLLEELLPAWDRGAAVVLMAGGLLNAGPHLDLTLRRYAITVLELTTAYWHDWVEDMVIGARRPPECLRMLLMGGEPALPERYQTWREFGIPLLHVFGLTETTITATIFREDRTPLSGQSRRLPIGKALANVLTYCLDPWMTPLPEGVAGELYIGGKAPGRGIHRRPGRTAASFVPNPYSIRPGERLYRTGDRCRYLACGNLDFGGRLDTQAKIRGYRIEPDEIASALVRQTAIREAVVTIRMDEAGEKRLVAYVALRMGGKSVPDGCKEAIAKTLPAYMLPSAYVVLDCLPLTPNGKVDLAALPQPVFEDRERATVPPKTPLERKLAPVWAEVLGLRSVSIHEDFFQMGGHSLMATRLVSRIRTAFEVDLPLRALFESPTLAGLAMAVEKARSLGNGDVYPLAGVPRTGAMPLSYSQQRLWFFHRMEGPDNTYNMPSAFRLDGVLDLALFHRCFTEIVKRHEILRTTFSELDGQPVQIIHAPLAPNLLVVEADEDRTLQMILEEARHPFDPEKGPLFRVRLWRIEPNRHIAMVNLHHIVSDGWSHQILIRELGALYRAGAGNEPSPLPELPIQYADYAHWQRHLFENGGLQSHLDFWKKELAGLPPLLALPTDHARPAVRRFKGTALPFAISPTLTASLQELCRREGVTPFMMLLAAFKVLLLRYSGQPDFAVGSPVANRTRQELEGLIGFFVNTLVLRSHIEGNPGFLDFLRSLKERTLAAYAHQDAPFDQVVEAVGPTRDLSFSPLFQVFFTMEAQESEEPPLPGLKIAHVPHPSTVAKFDLSLLIAETPRGLVGAWELNTDLFREETVARMSRHFRTLLESLVKDSGQTLWGLSMFDEKEKAALLARCEKAQESETPVQTVLQLVEARAKRHPDSVASSLFERRLTYAAMIASANRIANRLRKAGVRPGMTVGLLAELDPVLPAAILGIWKAGGLYLPLDPGLPEPRLSHIAEDSNVRAVVAGAGTAKSSPFLNGVPLVDLDWDGPEPDVGAPSNADDRGQAQIPAYAIYTSGSTGLPKGVWVSHRNLVSVLDRARRHFRIEAGDRMCCLASHAFDISLFEMLMPLLAGGSVVPVPRRAVTDLALLKRVLWEVNTLHAVPSLMGELLAGLRAEGNPETGAPGLRTVFVGGDAVPASLLAELRDSFPRARIFELYGPTETTIIATALSYESATGETRHTIGKALPWARASILDRIMNPAPAGIPGELCLGGLSVSMGYRNRPALTAARFVPDPFDVHAGDRLYRTGDRVCLAAGGDMVFMGRFDNQVKIRGFRIELGEIEAALDRHPHIERSAVLEKKDANGRPVLAAYLVPSEPGALETAEIRSFLARSLPDYMIPGFFTVLTEMPLMPTGKLDRYALPAPDLNNALKKGFRSPSNEMERHLAEIWSELLGISPIGIDHNFFELGGDSILCLRVVAKAGERGIRITARDLFTHQTVAALATTARAKEVTALRAEQGLVTGEVPLLPVQHEFLTAGHPFPQHFNQALLFEIGAATDPVALERAVHCLSRHHDALRARFRRSASGSWRQLIEERDVDTVFEIRELSLSGTEAESLGQAIRSIGETVQQGLSLERGPVWKVVLIEPGLGLPARLLILAHHLVVDGVSWRILLEDLQDAYRQASRGETPRLPPKTSSIRDWAEALARWSKGPDSEKDVAYWTEVAGRQLSPFPLDFPTGALGPGTVESERSISQALDREQTRALLQDVPSVYRTRIDDMLLAALVRTLTGQTGGGNLVVTFEGHGREPLDDSLDLSRTVGWFTSTYPLVLKPSGSGTGDLIKTIKEQIRAVPNRGLGFGALRRFGNTEVRNRLLRMARPRVSFNYLGQLDHVLEQDGLLSIAHEDPGPTRDPATLREHFLDIVCAVRGGRLQTTWNYSETHHEPLTVQRWAEAFIGQLETLIQHCLDPDAGGITPSDFSGVELTQQELDDVFDLIG